MDADFAKTALVPFDFRPATRVVFGNGALGRLGELAQAIGARRVLLVTDKGVVQAGHAARAQASLRQAGVAVSLFDEVRANPTTLDVARCVDAARAADIDAFIGLGGGSAMDTAKGGNFILTNGGEMKDYWGVGKATKPMLPLIAIPTTAGTGSECQSAALIADEQTHQKMACLDAKAAARIALLDPELTVSQPAGVTAATGIDALAHAVESAVTTARNAVSLGYAREAFTLCAAGLPQVLARPLDLAARGQMLLGASFAGMAIENSMLGAAHAAANPLTAHWGVVHGHAVGLMLPHVVRFNAADPAICRIYADLARSEGLAGTEATDVVAATALAGWIARLLERAGLPRSLREAGADSARIQQCAGEAAAQWTARFNPRPLTVDDFRALYTAAAETPAVA